MSLQPLVRRSAGSLLWLIPACLFLASGLSKLLVPVGTAPLLVSGAGDRIPYSIMLRSLGLAETCLAALVFMPRYRRVALFGITWALAAFSLFVAFNAADQRFIGNCGCFGVLDPTRGHSSPHFGWLVLRNALIGLLAMVGALTHSEGRTGGSRPLGALVGRAAAVAGFLLLVPMVIGEASLRLAGYKALDALTEAGDLSGYQGQALPCITLIKDTGSATSSDAALRAGDHIFFVSATCGHCRSLGPDLRRYDRELRATGDRAVLVVIGEPRVPTGFLEEIGCEGVVAFATSDRNAVLRLGITGVPELIVLGGERQVIYNEAFPTPATFWKSVDLSNRRIAGFSRGIWDSVAREIFGDRARCTDSPAIMKGLYQSEIVGTAEDDLWLYVVVEGARMGDMLELAIGVDSGDIIRGIIPLGAGAYIRVMDPAVSLVDGLVGMTLADAKAMADQRSEPQRLERRMWRTIGQALARIEEARRSRPRM